MSACILFHPEAYSTTGKKLMGRNAAGESFLNGYLKYAREGAHLWAYVYETNHAQEFTERARAINRSESCKTITNQNLGDLAEPATLFLPGPGLAEHARNRRLYGDTEWALCGITHTTSSANAMDAISSLITEPIQPWDALICTSNAVKENVKNILTAQIEEVKERLGATRIVLPKLPVIPLGIDTESFNYSQNDKVTSRQKLEINNETIVVLYVGRLSFHAKASPLAMYISLEEAAKKTGKNILLIECGWFANEFIENAFSEAQKALCPSVDVLTLDGRERKNRDLAWSSADIFCSLSDNIQETFGIVPLEAMASGLPVVVSDWDGYKDTVRNEVDGFRIRTLMAAPGLGGDLAHRHALSIDTYDMYCGYTSTMVSVDIPQCVDAFVKLIEDPSLRIKMGQSGRSRARSEFDWSRIIPIYERLWAEQVEMRDAQVAQRDEKNFQQNLPARLDPTISFAHYASAELGKDTTLKSSYADIDKALQRIDSLFTLKSVNYANRVLLSKEVMIHILTVARKETSLDLILGEFPQRLQPYIQRGIVAMIKFGLLVAR